MVSVRWCPPSRLPPGLKENAVTMHYRENKYISCVSGLLIAWLLAAGFFGLHAQAPLGQTAELPLSDLGQKTLHRLILGRGFAANAFGVRPFARPSTITNDDWLGGPGNWNSTNWSTGLAPTSSNNALINNSTPAAVVQLNVSPTINNLTIGSTSVLNFQNGQSLTIDGTTITNSNNTGTGGITLSSTGSNTALIIGSSAVTLTGGGIVTMSSNSHNLIYGLASTYTLTNLNNTIQGSG